MHSSLWLSALIVVPLLGALLAMLVRTSEGAAYVVGLATSVVELVLAVVVAVLYNNHIPGAQTFDFAARHVLAAPLGLAYDVALDGISLFLVLLAALAVLLALWGAREKRREPAFVAWMLLLTSFTIASFVSHDVLEFFIFFELTLIPSYFIISGWGGPQRSKAALFTVVMLASIGLPGLSGFVSEYLILIGTFATHAWWAVVASIGVVASAMYLLWAYQRVFHGRAEGPNAEITDASNKERWVMVPVVVLIVVLGAFPKPALDRISPSVQQLIEHVAPTGVSK